MTIQRAIDEVFTKEYSLHKEYLANAIIKVLEALPTRSEQLIDSDGYGEDGNEIIDKSEINKAIKLIKKKGNEWNM